MAINLDLQEIGFRKKLFVKDRRSVTDLFGKTRRCGIYILHFENGEFYVGQAIDVTSRYCQHRLNHNDIEHISFKVVPKKFLNQVERETIGYMEGKSVSLRNISLVSITRGESELDNIIPTDDQEDWLIDEPLIETFETERFQYPEQRKKYSGRFKKLTKRKDHEIIYYLLQGYILFTIPFPRRTEYFFWSLTCLPSESIMSRVNIFWQETLRIYEFMPPDSEPGLTKENYLSVLFFSSKSILFKNHSKDYFLNKYRSLDFPDIVYQKGGQDQQAICCYAYEFLDILCDTEVRTAVKTLNLRLLRKGSCIFGRYHCFDLADQVLRTDILETK